MKHFLFFFLFVFLCSITAKAQTNVNIAGPENVLVVYKQPNNLNDTLGNISKDIRDYYLTARGINSLNSISLTLPDTAYFNGSRVILFQEGEIIKQDASLFKL